MKTGVGINGFGRIGRLFLREAILNKNFNIVAINDLGTPQSLGTSIVLAVTGPAGKRLKVEVVDKNKKVKDLDENFDFPKYEITAQVYLR